MRRLEVEVFGEETNSWVLRLPGRTYPGVVIQGDSLYMLLSSAEELRARLGEPGELRDLAAELCTLLRGHLSGYEAVLRAHDLPLPYTRPAPPL